MIFLIAVFLSYVMYGLVASLFSCTWPQMALDVNIDYTLIGMLTVITSLGSGLSSAYSYRIRRMLGTSKSISFGLGCFMMAMLLFFTGSNVLMICFALAFVGMGSGIVDTIANSYIIKAYDSTKLSFLHASWGLGSVIGPLVISLALTRTSSYKNGFLWVTILLVLMIVYILTLKVYWEGEKKNREADYVARHSVSEEEKNSKTNLLDIFKINNGLTFVSCFIVFGAANSIISVWMATLAVGQRGLSVAEGATAAAFYFAGLTATRVILGIVAKKIENYKIIFGSAIVLTVGCLLLFIRNDSAQFMYFAATIIGIGVSPLIPFLHSSVKEVFEEEYMGIVVSCCNSLSLVGSALASAFTTFLAKLIGINNIQIMFVVLTVVGAFLYKQVLKNNKKTA